jgi:hypothetical protein
LNIKYGYRIHYFMSKDDIISVELHFDQWCVSSSVVPMWHG